MFPHSYADVFELAEETPAGEEIQAGDMVRMGRNFHPHYEVIAVQGETAWVRNLETGSDHLAKVERCRKLAEEAERIAA